MKKFILGFAAAAMAVSAMAVTASAANVSGAKAYYTEVEAFINNVPVEAFMVDNQTCIRTSQVEAYGFYHEYDNDARQISITATNVGGWYDYVSAWTSMVTPGVPFFNNSAYAGTVYKTSVPSNIEVVICGTPVVSYHLGDEVLIRLKDLEYAIPKTVANPQPIVKGYSGELKKSWLDVKAVNQPTDPASDVLAPAAFLSTEDALAKAIALIATEYNGLEVQNSGSEWRSFYANVMAPVFSFPVIDSANGLFIGNVTVSYNNAVVDYRADAAFPTWAEVNYAK